MNNTSNDFASQLNALFNELHTVLQSNLANKVSKEDVDNLAGQIMTIQNILSDTVRRIQEIEKKMQTYDAKFTQITQKLDSIQQSSVRVAPPVQPQIVQMPPPQPSAAHSSSVRSHTDQSSTDKHIAKDEVVAGREITVDKFSMIATNLPVIEANEFTRQITNSQSYKESNLNAKLLVENAIDLLNDKDSEIVAIQTCILIDILNMVFYKNKNYKWYTIFIKKPTKKTIVNLTKLFSTYGLLENILTPENVQRAVEQLADFSEEQIHQRIKNSSIKLSSTFEEFQKNIKKTINDRSVDNNTNEKNSTPNQP